MPDSPAPRLGSAHLEDLAIVALCAAQPRSAPQLHPELDPARRARLRSRLQQIGRHDWPSSLKEDPLLRRGYTLRQCVRLITALMLIDAHLPPSEAIAIAKANERGILRAVALRLGSAHQDMMSTGADDVIVVVPLGELVSLVAEKDWRAARAQAVRLVRRDDLPSVWSDDADLAFAGQRLVLDVGLAAAAAWQWLRARALMPNSAREQLLAEIEAERHKSGFTRIDGPVLRRV